MRWILAVPLACTVTPSAPTVEAAAASGSLPAPLFGEVAPGCGAAAGVGEPVKNFKLPSVTGKSISPEYYRGRVMLLNFWGTWCKPCLEELPEFSRMYRQYREHGMTLVAVATDDDRNAVAAMVEEHKLVGKIAYEGEATAEQYGDRPFPFTFDHKCLGAVEHDIRAQLGGN